MEPNDKSRVLEATAILPAIHLQNLSELERFRLQEIALFTLQQLGLCADIKPGYQNSKKVVKRKQDRKGTSHGLFGVTLSDVINQDRVERQRILPVRNRRACAEVESSVMSFRVQTQHSSNRGMLMDLPLSSIFRDGATQIRRRGALSVNSIAELDDGDDRLLEALQLSHPAELSPQQENHNHCLSLNPIYKQVPRIVERCCSHIEKYGLQTVGIFRIGSSKKRVNQLQEDFAISGDMLLGEDTCVHDVSAVLKAFLRDLKDPLLPQELYKAFIHTADMTPEERFHILQLLICTLPPCNADTLLRILQLLKKVSLYEKDTIDHTGEQTSGNKMSVANLATIFGPNLLQSEKSLENERQSFQDSAAQIQVTDTLIQYYQELYMIPSQMHVDIIMSLLKTDPEVVDYLLRQKSAGTHKKFGIGEQDSQQWRMSVITSLVPHSPSSTLMQLLSTGGRTGFFDSPLCKRRPSRSQEDLTVFPAVTTHKGFLPALP
ncbi:rho GTPase-activating protein 6-like [Hyla sarda]|uniref:rho GTPase-activating protein 6-like n=1 Tax=Hyla sarda TaxID=327740 RepID=UPI0024C40E05|nr:rho GTPase-activating protein 6-like [Hyla sarda]